MRGLSIVYFMVWTACQSASGGSADATFDDAAGDTTPDVIGQTCEVNADCSDAVCDRGTRRCVACRVGADCGRDETCVVGQCTAATLCESDLDCTGAGQVCGPSSECVRCVVAADCGAGNACVQGACVVASACESSLDCAATRQVCGPVTGAEWPEGVVRVCKDCHGDADCGPGDRCDGGLCISVCHAADAVCGELEFEDGSSVSCGECAGYCSAEQRVCAATTPIGVELWSAAFVDGSDQFYGVDARVRERVLVGDKRTNVIATLLELPIVPNEDPIDDNINAVVAVDISSDDPGILYVLTSHRTLWRVPLADPAARTALLGQKDDIESCNWLDVVGSYFAGGCFTGVFFGRLDGTGTGSNTDITYGGALVGERLFANQSFTVNEVARDGLMTVLYTTRLAVHGLVAHEGWLYFGVSEEQPVGPTVIVLHRVRVLEAGVGEPERLGPLSRVLSASSVGFFGRVCDDECNYALIDPLTLRPKLLGKNADWAASALANPTGIYRDASGTLRMILGSELLAFPH